MLAGILFAIYYFVNLYHIFSYFNLFLMLVGVA